MTRLVPISGKKLCKILEKIGFEKIYGKGSHIRFRHKDGKRTVVPVHANEEIGISLLREILRQIKLSRGDYEKLRREV
jgi:predicted RNA binding protein YcfA (HicA-like mRNA interferase family)